MFEPKIKLDRVLYGKLEERAEALGYATVDEYVRHILEGAVKDVSSEEADEEVRKRLKGLGYLG